MRHSYVLRHLDHIDRELAELVDSDHPLLFISRRASRRKLPWVSRVIAAATSGEVSFLGSCTPVGAHDLRRTCAKLCRKAGGDLEQIKLLLGHSSIQTTEWYFGSEQEIAVAVNDAIGL